MTGVLAVEFLKFASQHDFSVRLDGDSIDGRRCAVADIEGIIRDAVVSQSYQTPVSFAGHFRKMAANQYFAVCLECQRQNVAVVARSMKRFTDASV